MEDEIAARYLSTPLKKTQTPPGFIAIAAATYCVVMGVGLLSPVLPLYVRQWGLSNTAAALLLSAFAAGRIPVSLPAGRFSDRYGYKPVAYLGILVAFISAIISILASNYFVLLISLFIQGVGAGIFTTTSNAAVIKYSDRQTVGRISSVYQGVILAGLSFSPVLGSVAAQVGGLRGPFFLYLSALVLGAFLLRYASQFMTTDSADGKKQKTSRALITYLLTKPAFRNMLFASVIVFAALAGIRNTLLPLYAAEKAHLTEIQIGWMLTASATANILVLYPAGRAVDTIGRRPVLVFGMIAMGISAAFLAGAHVLIWLIVGAVIAGTAKGIAAAPLLPLVADIAPDEMKAEVVGFYRIAVSLGLFVGPAILGGLADIFEFQAAFLTASVFLIFTGVVLTRMPETRPGVT